MKEAGFYAAYRRSVCGRSALLKSDKLKPKAELRRIKHYSELFSTEHEWQDSYAAEEAGALRAAGVVR